MKENFEVDLVYTWVDGNDPAWRAKHAAFTGTKLSADDVDCEGRYADNDELRYSLRSVELYAPWIRHIYIITDGQIPSWLNLDNDRISIVDHKEIIPEHGLPCFNSQVIEHCMYRIPGLAEHFIYANDDMFLNRPVDPWDFFTPDGKKPIVRTLRSPLRRFTLWMKDRLLSKPLSRYNRALLNASRLVNQRYGKYYSEKSHHNMDSYLKSQFELTARDLGDVIEPTISNHLREENDIQRIVYSYVPLALGQAQRVHVGKDTSFMLRIHRHSSYERLARYNPKFFCLNDSQYATDEDRRLVKKFLKERFPEKSSFEK